MLGSVRGCVLIRGVDVDVDAALLLVVLVLVVVARSVASGGGGGGGPVLARAARVLLVERHTHSLASQLQSSPGALQATSKQR